MHAQLDDNWLGFECSGEFGFYSQPPSGGMRRICSHGGVCGLPDEFDPVLWEPVPFMKAISLPVYQINDNRQEKRRNFSRI